MTEYYMAVVSVTDGCVIIDRLALTGVFPWAVHLDEEDQQEMLETLAGRSDWTAAEMQEELRAWQRTADVLAGPEERRALLSEFNEEDFVDAPRPEGEPTYAEKVSAPLSEAAIDALNRELASGNYARFKRSAARDLEAVSRRPLPPGRVRDEILNMLAREEPLVRQEVDPTKWLVPPGCVSECVEDTSASMDGGDWEPGPLADEFRAGITVAPPEVLAELERAERAAMDDSDIPDGDEDAIHGNVDPSTRTLISMVTNGAGAIEVQVDLDEDEPNERVVAAAGRLDLLVNRDPAGWFSLMRKGLMKQRDDARALALALKDVLSEVCDEWDVDNPKFEGKLPGWFTGNEDDPLDWNPAPEHEGSLPTDGNHIVSSEARAARDALNARVEEIRKFGGNTREEIDAIAEVCADFERGEGPRSIRKLFNLFEGRINNL